MALDKKILQGLYKIN